MVHSKRNATRSVSEVCAGEAKQQKVMLNSSHQCENAQRSFAALEDVQMPKHVLLIDDVVDSRWTLTVCGFMLLEAGCLKVFPFALADSSQRRSSVRNG